MGKKRLERCNAATLHRVPGRRAWAAQAFTYLHAPWPIPDLMQSWTASELTDARQRSSQTGSSGWCNWCSQGQKQFCNSAELPNVGPCGHTRSGEALLPSPPQDIVRQHGEQGWLGFCSGQAGLAGLTAQSIIGRTLSRPSGLTGGRWRR